MQVTIPKNWNKVTIEGYVSFMKSINKKTETAAELVRLQISRACYLTGCEVEEAQKLTTTEYSKVKKLATTPLPQNLKTSFKLKGIRYRLIHQAQKLTGDRTDNIRTLDAKLMNGGQYASVMNCVKRGHLDTLHQILFNLCEPMKFGFRNKLIFIGWKPYDFKEHEVEERINDFHSLTLDVANPASVFFCKVSKLLIKSLEDYSYSQLREMNKQMKKLQADLIADSDGLQ